MSGTGELGSVDPRARYEIYQNGRRLEANLNGIDSSYATPPDVMKPPTTPPPSSFQMRT